MADDSSVSTLQTQFTALTTQERHDQLRELVAATPHNDDVIHDGEFCRGLNFFDEFSMDEITRLYQIYTENEASVRPGLLAEECEGALMRYFRTKDQSSLRTAVNIGSLVAYHVSLNEENIARGVLLSVFARTLLVKWQAFSSNDELLDASIYYCSKAVELDSDKGWNRALHLNDLGEQLAARYSKNHSISDYERADECFTLASQLQPSGKPVFLFLQAKMKRERNIHEGCTEVDMLDQYISNLAAAVRMVKNDFKPTDYRVSLSHVYWRLGWAFWDRYQLKKTPEDLGMARKSFEISRLVPRHGAKDLFRACLDLGRVVAIQFKQTRILQDGQLAIDMLREALRIEPNTIMAMESLGQHLCEYAMFINSDDLLLESGEILERAYLLTETPDNSLCDARSITLMRKFQRTENRNDIDEAIRQFTALSELPQQDDEGHANYLKKLAECYRLRFQSFEHQDDLDHCQTTIERAISLKNVSSVIKSDCLRILGTIMFARYRWMKQSQFLTKAIVCFNEALVTSDDKVTAYLVYNDLANALYRRYTDTLSADDLSASIQNYRSSLEVLRESTWKNTKSADLMVLQGLAISLTTQSQITRQKVDIDAAILCFEKCLQGTSKRTKLYVNRANNLAMAYQERFKLTRDMEDAKKSQAVLLEILNWELNLAPVDLCNMENNLGRAFLLSYLIHKEPTYIHHAREHFQKALETKCTEPSYLLTASINLSHVLRIKAERTKDALDTHAALLQLAKTVQYAQTKCPDDPWKIHSLIFSVVEYIVHSWIDSGRDANSFYGQLYINVSRTMIPLLKTLPRSLIAILYIHAAYAQHIVAKQPAAARDMVRAAAAELPAAILLSMNRADVLQNLEHLGVLPSLAISFSLAAGDSPLDALQLFDKVRSVIWDHLLSSRLATQEADKGQFAHLQAKLEQLQSSSPRPKPQGAISVGGDLSDFIVGQHELYRQAVAYKQIQDEIRSQPELDGFLRLPGDISGLIKYATEGPVIIINHSTIRSDGIIVTLDGVNSIPLPLLTEKALQENERWYSDALHLMGKDLKTATELLDRALTWLWEAAAEPILEYLGFRGADSEHELPRTWWITTDRIGMFPIHAAGDHKKALEGKIPCTVLDRTVPSYINSLRSLGYARSRQYSQQERQATEQRALLVSMGITPGMGEAANLPYAVQEVAEIKQLLDKQGVRSKQLDCPKRDTVLHLLRGADFAHFACHGVCDKEDPARSILRLADWMTKPLNVESILQAGVLGCQLVYLSACETGSNKSQFKDEGLHPAGGFQMAGVPHVIASLWRVDDAVSVEIARTFYGELEALRNNINSIQAAAALRGTILKLRALEISPLYWAAYVHFGP